MALADLRLKKINQSKGLYTGDNELPDGHGLSVRISEKRKRVFQFRYRVEDLASGKLKAKRIKLGDYLVMSIKSARSELSICKEMLEKGIEHFIERYVKIKRKTPTEIENLFANHVTPVLGDLPAKDVALAHWLPIFDCRSSELRF